MKYILNITLGMGMLWLSAGYAKAQQVELLKPKDLDGGTFRRGITVG